MRLAEHDQPVEEALPSRRGPADGDELLDQESALVPVPQAQEHRRLVLAHPPRMVMRRPVGRAAVLCRRARCPRRAARPGRVGERRAGLRRAVWSAMRADGVGAHGGT
jgi:hypothetical protein